MYRKGPLLLMDQAPQRTPLTEVNLVRYHLSVKQ
jgi:hypothetical protein